MVKLGKKTLANNYNKLSNILIELLSPPQRFQGSFGRLESTGREGLMLLSGLFPSQNSLEAWSSFVLDKEATWSNIRAGTKIQATDVVLLNLYRENGTQQNKPTMRSE